MEGNEQLHDMKGSEVQHMKLHKLEKKNEY